VCDEFTQTELDLSAVAFLEYPDPGAVHFGGRRDLFLGREYEVTVVGARYTRFSGRTASA
jgi:hypothetical protein